MKKILERRKDALEENGKIEWALAESLAFASILQEGTPIRLTGQDSGVVYSHTVISYYTILIQMKHIHRYIAYQTLMHRSLFITVRYQRSLLLVTNMVITYSLETLVMWEAQYGDFSNTAQALFDQYVSAGRAKWGQKLVLLLPHGYEGQGQEHSSARRAFLTVSR